MEHSGGGGADDRLRVTAALKYEPSRWLTLAQDHGDFDSVLAHLRSGCAADAARKCVRALLIATANSPAKQSQACAAGAADAAVAALKAHSADAVVVREVCLMLWTFGDKREGFCKRVVALGALAALVHAMRLHSTNVDVQDEALTALHFFTANHDDLIARSCVAGVIPAVTAAVRTCTAGKAQAQTHGCAVLSTLIKNGADQDDAAEAGAVQTVLAALRAHPPQDVFLHRSACKALHTMTTNWHATNCAATVEAGVIEQAVDTLRAHATAGGNTSVLLSACTLLSAVMRLDTAWQARGIELGAVKLFVRIMRVHAAEHTAVAMACITLVNAFLGPMHDTNPAGCAAAMAAGCFDAVVAALHGAHGTSAFLQQGALMCLTRLTASQQADFQCASAAAGCIDAAVAVLLQRRDASCDAAEVARIQNVEHSCCQLLLDVTNNNASNQHKAAHCGAIQAVMAVLRAHRCSSSTECSVENNAPPTCPLECGVGALASIALACPRHAMRAGLARLLPRLQARVHASPCGRMCTSAANNSVLSMLAAFPLDAAAPSCDGGCMRTDAPQLKICTRCRWARYCSEECQRAAWPEHKRACKCMAARKLAEEEVASLD
jgi:hypothetical protein